MRFKKILRITGMTALLFAAAFFLLPWQQFVEKKLVAAFEAKGFTPAVMTLDHIGWRGIVLKNIALGEPPLRLATATVGYQPRALLKGRIEDVEVEGLIINAMQDSEGWHADGLDALLQPKAAPTKPFAIPVTQAAMRALPFDSIRLRDASFQLTAKNWQAATQINLALSKDKFTAETKNLTGQMGDTKLAIGNLALTLALNETKQQWEGTWAMDDIRLTSEKFPAPPLKASGIATVMADSLTLDGAIVSADKTYDGAFSLTYSLTQPSASQLTISRASIPFSGGKLATHNVTIALGEKKPMNVTLEVQNIAVDSLLQVLTSNRATATGAVSGSLPITVQTNGQLRIGKGSLGAQQPGIITLSPDVIPGDNAQVTLVRDVMKNLHYTILALDFEQGEGNAMAVTLKVEGRNPDVENGRAVRLKVQLSGDLLDLITQNMKLMSDPTSYIEQKP